jgi:hypothetical protein
MREVPPVEGQIFFPPLRLAAQVQPVLRLPRRDRKPLAESGAIAHSVAAEQFGVIRLSADEGRLMPPPGKQFVCGGCGESFTSFKAAARHAWTPDECKGEPKTQTEIIEEIAACLDRPRIA